MKYFIIIAVSIVLIGCQTTNQAANIAKLEVAFSWAGTKACSTVPPAFSVSNVPKGTTALKFRMTDLDVPSFNHGGGTIHMGTAEIPAGSFSYTGPCPPSGSHKYEFEVTAINEHEDLIVARGAAVRSFPPE